MLKPIRLIAATALALAAITATAATNYLHFSTPNGWVVLDLDKVDNLTFENGIMKANDKAGNVVASHPQTELQDAYVDQTAGIADAKADAAGAFALSADGRTVTASTGGTFAVYNLGGERLVAIPGVESGQTIELQGLAKGVYIIQLGKYAIKNIVK